MAKPTIIVYDSDTREDIDDLADVVITSPADNEVLAYDTATSKWINQTAAEAGLAGAYVDVAKEEDNGNTPNKDKRCIRQV